MNISPLMALVIFSIVGFVIYGFSLNNEFVYDDIPQILLSPFVQNISYTISAFGKSLIYPGQPGLAFAHIYYRPLVQSVYALLYALSGATPLAYHLTQLCAHIVSAFLVFLIFRKFFRSWTSLVLALIFLVHPINSEVVLYVGDMQDSLYMVFGLAAFYVGISINKHTWLRICSGVMLLILSLLSKEEGILFVVMGVIYALIMAKKRVWSASLTSAIALIVYIPMRYIASLNTVGSVVPSVIHRLSPGIRLMTVPKIILYYISKLVIPVNFAIAQQWYVTKLNSGDVYIPLFIDCVFVVVCAAGGIYAAHHRSHSTRTYLFYACWLVVGILMHMPILPMDLTVADRWFYFPLIGILGMAGVMIECVSENVSKSTRVGILVGAIVLIALLGILANARSAQWSSPMTLYSHDIEYVTSSPSLYSLYAEELMRSGDSESARPYLEQSIQQDPLMGMNIDDLARIEEASGNIKGAKQLYEREIGLTNGLPKYTAYQGLVRISIFRDHDMNKAIKLSREGLKNSPYDQLLKTYLAVALYRTNHRDQALDIARGLVKTNHDEFSRHLYKRIMDNDLSDESLSNM